MMITILGISLVVNSTRAGGDMLPMIGPRTRPRNRSMIVQAAPPATWKNSTGHSLFEAMPAISRDHPDRGEHQALAGNDLEVGDRERWMLGRLRLLRAQGRWRRRSRREC